MLHNQLNEQLLLAAAVIALALFAAYVQVVQLHVGLLDHFGALPNGEELIKKLRATLQKTATETKSPPTDEIITTQPTGAQS